MKHFCHKCSLQSISLFLLILLLILSILPVLPASASAPGPEEPEEELLYYTALGDSIPNGYSADGDLQLENYPILLADDLQVINQTPVQLMQFTKNGLTTAKLNASFLTQPEVHEALAKSDVITLTIGANDLMNEFKKVSREILGNETIFHTADEALQALQQGISDNPLLLVDVVGAITGWDYDSFEEQWLLTVKSIHDLRKSESQMAVTTIYNPVEKAELPGTLNAVVKSLITKMNEIIYDHAEEYHYQVVDLLDSGIAEHTQSDGLHPDQKGQELIRSLIESALDMQIIQTAEVTEQAESEAAALAKERIAAEQKAAEQKLKQARQKRLLRTCLFAGGGLLACLSATAAVRRKKKQKRSA